MCIALEVHKSGLSCSHFKDSAINCLCPLTGYNGGLTAVSTMVCWRPHLTRTSQCFCSTNLLRNIIVNNFLFSRVPSLPSAYGRDRHDTAVWGAVCVKNNLAPEYDI